MNNIDQLQQAKELLDKGAISEEEFAALKKKLLTEDPNEEVTIQQNVPPQGATAGPAVAVTANAEDASTGMKILSFIIPIAGLILFFVDKSKKPVAAKQELKWAGIGLGVRIILWAIYLTFNIGIAAALLWWS